MSKAHRREEPRTAPDGSTRFERVALDWVRGQGDTLRTAAGWLVVSVALTAAFVGVAAWQLRDNVALQSRGRPGQVRVVRVNDGRKELTVNGVYVTGPVGREVIAEHLRTHPRTGGVIDVVYDPRNPGDVVEAGVPIWRWSDLFLPGFTVAWVLVSVARWMRFARLWRERRRPSG